VAEGGLFDKMKFVDVVIMPLHVHFGFPAHTNQATPTAPPTTATASTPHLRLSTPAAPVWSPGFDDCVPVAGDCCPPVSVPVALAPTYAKLVNVSSVPSELWVVTRKTEATVPPPGVYVVMNVLPLEFVFVMTCPGVGANATADVVTNVEPAESVVV